MPCYDPDARDLRAHQPVDYAPMNKALDKLDALTKIMCDACRVIEKNNDPWPTKEMMEWWQGHQNSKGHHKP